MRRALKFMWDLSMMISGSFAWPTSKNGMFIFCSGIINLQKDSITSSSVALNSKVTCKDWNESSVKNLFFIREFYAIILIEILSTIYLWQLTRCNLTVYHTEYSPDPGSKVLMNSYDWQAGSTEQTEHTWQALYSCFQIQNV